MNGDSVKGSVHGEFYHIILGETDLSHDTLQSEQPLSADEIPTAYFPNTNLEI